MSTESGFYNGRVPNPSPPANYHNPDLHCHSLCSDGTLSPQALAARAREGGVDLWALTDHDEVSGIAQARAAAHAQGLAFLTGVEVSVTFAGQTVHIVGLGFDEQDPALVAGLRHTRSGRTRRAQAMAEQLALSGVRDAYEGALRYVSNPELVSRTHFARYLVEAGYCHDTSEVFRRFLSDGKPGYVPHQWAGLGETVRWIRDAGGVAVVAHPARYRFTPNEEYALLSEFKAHGGQGIEVVTGSHTAAEALRYADVAQEFDFVASRGSDFHSPEESHTDLGRLPPLPPALPTVWELLQSRIELPPSASASPAQPLPTP